MIPALISVEKDRWRVDRRPSVGLDRAALTRLEQQLDALQEPVAVGQC